MNAKRSAESFEFGEIQFQPFPAHGTLLSRRAKSRRAFLFRSAEIFLRRPHFKIGWHKLPAHGPGNFSHCPKPAARNSSVVVPTFSIAAPVRKSTAPILKTQAIYAKATVPQQFAIQIAPQPTPTDLDCGGRARRRHGFRAHANPSLFVSRFSAPRRRGTSLPAAVQNMTLAPPQSR